MKYFSIPVILFVSICLFNFTNDLNKDRISYESLILSGLSGFPSEVKYINESAAIIESLPVNSDVKFDCADGLYAVIGGVYRPSDRYFVNWSPDYSDSTQDYKFIFQCNVPFDSDLPKGYILMHRVLIKDGEFGIYNGLVNRLVTLSQDGA